MIVISYKNELTINLNNITLIFKMKCFNIYLPCYLLDLIIVYNSSDENIINSFIQFNFYMSILSKINNILY